MALGGDHAVSYPLLRAQASVRRGLTVVHLDAHPDLYDELDGDRYSHACPFARVMEERLVDRLIQVGIRTLNRHQRAQAERFGVEVIDMRNLHTWSEIVLEGDVYLSVDMDVLDPSCAPGVSHHEPGGLTTRQALSIVQGIEAPIVGADLVELNPLRDPNGMTAMAAAKLFKEMLGKMLEASGPIRGT